MPKLASTIVKEREAFVTDFVVNNPKATGQAINEAVAARFSGTKMRAKRLYALRETARASIVTRGVPAAPVQADEIPVIDTVGVPTDEDTVQAT